MEGWAGGGAVLWAQGEGGGQSAGWHEGRGREGRGGATQERDGAWAEGGEGRRGVQGGIPWSGEVQGV